MKYLKKFETYKDFIGSGVDHEVYFLDDDWVILTKEDWIL